MKTFYNCCLLLCAFFAHLLINCGHAEEDNPLSISAPVVAVEIGESLTITCVDNDTYVVEWYAVESPACPIPQNQSLRVRSENNTLIINDVHFNDSGDYECRMVNSTYNVTVTVKAYVMPTYLTEGIIVVGTGGGVLVLFLLCLLISFVLNRRSSKK